MYSIALYSFYALCSGSGLIILKIAMNKKTEQSLTMVQALFQKEFFIGFILYGCGFLLWMVILSKYKLNVAYPVATSLFFIVAGLGSYFILKESISTVHIVGIILCIGGILLINVR